MNIEELERISRRTWCRQCLLLNQIGNHKVSLEKIMHDDRTMFQLFVEVNGTRTFQSEFENLKEAFAEYELRA